jgi:cell division protein FtsB
MFDFYEKRKLKSLLFSKVTLAVLAVVVAFFATNVWGVYQKAHETSEKRAQLEKEFAELQAREATLREELDRLHTNRGMEEEIRSKFDVAREGERVIVVVDPKPVDALAGAGEKKGFWKRLFDWF